VSAPPQLVDALCATLAFRAQGDRTGNLTTGSGTLGGRAVRIALIENRFASGAIGVAEAEPLIALLKIAALERSPLVIYLDSAGAKVSEGLRALGAFRALFRAGLELALSGAPVAAVLGKNCYGGSSMFAHLASQRLFSPGTQLAMSGPAILAAAAGMSAVDEMFRAMAESSLSPAARAKASAANTVWAPGGDLGKWLREALAPRGDPATGLRFRHEALAARFEKRAPDPQWESVRRRDLERIYEAGYEARESQGLLEGQGRRGGMPESFLGLVGKQPLGAARAWRFAETVWRHAAKPPAHLEVYLDCATHAARIEDEKMVLTEFIVDMSFALMALAAAGTRVGLTIAGQAGGGVYVALAAPAKRVASVHGADIQVLPGAAVAAILGQSKTSVATFDDYRASGVADEELKLGLIP
jgi:Carboxyl transferase domain/Malonate decarboxylase gamma subunit (MdcE)